MLRRLFKPHGWSTELPRWTLFLSVGPMVLAGAVLLVGCYISIEQAQRRVDSYELIRLADEAYETAVTAGLNGGEINRLSAEAMRLRQEGMADEQTWSYLQHWPLVFFGLILLSMTSLAYRTSVKQRRQARLKDGLCPSCGYDLRASPERCPECGAAATTAAESV